jgi:hypothetical protein
MVNVTLIVESFDMSKAFGQKKEPPTKEFASSYRV